MFSFLQRKPSEEFYNTLVEKYHEEIFRFVLRRVQDRDDAADICQEIFIRAYRSLNSLKDPDAARGWLYRIAANETNRFLTDSHRTHIIPEAETENLVEPTASEADSIDSETINKAFRKGLETLSKRQRTVFELRYFQELPYEEIARTMDSNVATMKATYHIAKEKIKDSLMKTI